MENTTQERRIYSITTSILFVIMLIASFFIPSGIYPTSVVIIGFAMFIVISLLLIMSFLEKFFNDKLFKIEKVLGYSLITLIEESMMFFLSTFLFTNGVILGLNLGFSSQNLVRLIGYLLTSGFTHLIYKRFNKTIVGIIAITALITLFIGIGLYNLNHLFILFIVLASFLFSALFYWLFNVQIPSETH